MKTKLFVFLLTIPIGASCLFAQPTPLTLTYKLNGNTLEEASQGYQLSNSFVTYTSDRFGNSNSAALLNGTSSYMMYHNFDSFNTNQFTVAAWVKPVTLPANNSQRSIVCFGDQTFDHGINLANNYYNVWDGFTGYSYNSLSGNMSAFDSLATVSVTTNSWYHIAIVRGTDSFWFYINGQLIESEPVYQNMGFASSGNKLWIGARYGSSSYFNGAVDEVVLSNRAMTGAQIQSLFAPPAAPVPLPLCVEYNFDNNTLDSGGQGYHLTNHGGTFTSDRFNNSNAAVQLDGTDDYLIHSNADSFNTNEFTLTAWVKPYSLPANNSQTTIAAFGDQNDDHGLNLANNYFNIWNGFTAYSYNSTGGNISCYDSLGTIAVSTNTWYHVAVTRSASITRFFINGQLIETESVPLPMGFAGSGNEIWIGSRYGTMNYFHGAIDDIHLCNRAMSDSAVLALYTPANTTDIAKEAGKSDFNVYPNPSASGHYTIHSETGIATIKVINSLGQKIDFLETSQGSIFIEAPKGTYVLLATMKNGQQVTRKIVIQ